MPGQNILGQCDAWFSVKDFSKIEIAWAATTTFTPLPRPPLFPGDPPFVYPVGTGSGSGSVTFTRVDYPPGKLRPNSGPANMLRPIPEHPKFALARQACAPKTGAYTYANLDHTSFPCGSYSSQYPAYDDTVGNSHAAACSKTYAPILMSLTINAWEPGWVFTFGSSTRPEENACFAVGALFAGTSDPFPYSEIIGTHALHVEFTSSDGVSAWTFDVTVTIS